VRIAGAAENTVTKLLFYLGRACEQYQAATMVDLACVLPYIQPPKKAAPKQTDALF